MIGLTPLVVGNLRRHWLRTTFTVGSIFVAFVLFGFLSAIRLAFSLGVDVTGADRLLTINSVSLIQPLPMRYGDRMREIDQVEDATYATWFAGVYQDPKNFFPQIAVVPETFLDIYPEYLLSDAAREAFESERTAAIAGRALAKRFGWEVGDKIPIQGTVYRQKDGNRLWTFDLVGIYEPREPGVDDSQLFFRHEYLEEARDSGKGDVGWYILRIEDPSRAAEVASRVDALFENSDRETRTTTEKAFIQGFAEQIGDIGAILQVVLSAVFAMILLVAGNTMAQSVRERTAELSVLKTLGFTGRHVLGLVLAESLAIAVLGGGTGLAIVATWIRAAGDPTGVLPAFTIRGADVARGAVLIVGMGVAAGAIPALRALRLRIVDGLRRG